MSRLDSFFKISERNSSVSTEVLGGLTTFLTMAYVIAVNPSILQAAGMSFSAALTATCIGAGVTTIAMGLIANRPLALASGMGLNAVVAFSICVGLGLDWRVAMSVVFVEGLLILVLVMLGLREAVMKAVPVSLQHAIAIGIGLFIAFLGLKSGGLIVADEATFVSLGSVTSPGAIVSLVSIAVAVVLTALKVKAALLISIVVAVVLGLPLGVSTLPTEWSFGLDFSSFAAPFQATPDGTVALMQVFVQPILLIFVFSLLMSDFFDTMGSVVAVGKQAGFAEPDGTIKDARKILAVDAAAAATGGFVGASSITTYVESTAGASAGARTGLSNLVVGIAFFACAFLAPFVGMVGESATCGALVVVGYLMIREIGSIDWEDLSMAFPAFIIIIVTPLTYSIANGIGAGFIAYCLVSVAQGKAKQVKPLMWVVSAAFLVSFILSA